MIDNKKAFTLIELLAVILILGIIAFIAIPSVNKMLEESKVSSFEATLNNVSKKVKETCTLEIANRKKVTEKYRISGGVPSPFLELKGTLPNGGISVDSKCNVTYILSDDTYMGTKNDPNGKVVVEKCKGNCVIDLSYKEVILNGANPELDEGMIPVTIENDGTVKKINLEDPWYSYENKEWANAVLVSDSTRNSYKEASAGSTITASDILGYFVWIPRYKYKISTGGTTEPGEIDIVFENKNTTKSNGNAKDEYLTHPGFTFGDSELNGIWVAKFETTGNANVPTSLPNTSSLRDQAISKQFATALKFNNYGITNDAHMIKNSEWGAAAYLSHSKYGINKEVRLNNNSNYTTGCGAIQPDEAGSSACQIAYGSNTNELPQSTTGNITGIFDMAGGAWDRVMGNYGDTLSGSGFYTMPDSKYYDVFETSSYLTACNSSECLGHAATETKGWYSDYYNDPSSYNNWTYRGGHYIGKTSAGIFSIYNSFSGASSGYGFRVVIN